MTDDRTPLSDALAEALDTRVQHYTLSVEPDDSAYMELDPDGRYVIAEEVADAILAHPAVIAAIDRSDPWAAAMSDPAFVAALEQGIVDAKEGRVSSWAEVQARLPASGYLPGARYGTGGNVLAGSEPAGLRDVEVERELRKRLTRHHRDEHVTALTCRSCLAALAATPTASPTAGGETKP